jgi:hypothetical protein
MELHLSPSSTEVDDKIGQTDAKASRPVDGAEETRGEKIAVETDFL